MVALAETTWDTEELGRLAEITVGHVGPMVDEYLTKGVPFLRSLNVRPFRIETADLMYISDAFHARLAKSALRPGVPPEQLRTMSPIFSARPSARTFGGVALTVQIMGLWE